MIRFGRLGALTVAATLLLAASTMPSAAAHGFNGAPIPDAAQYLSAITAISPATAGVSASIDPRGEWIEVTNSSATPLVVLGYSGEPYLRLDRTGVAQNAYSPSVALNQALFAQVTTSAENLPPYWQQLHTGTAARWHDHRIHWMGASRPPNVAAHPALAQLVGNWTVQLTQAGKPITISGTLSWLSLKPRRGLSNTAKLLLASDSIIFVLAVLGVWLFLSRRRHAQSPPHEDEAGQHSSVGGGLIGAS
ncbi:MAG: hypothetical protein ABI140_14750 [Jatrophihabitantaceae bacterium]